MSRGRGHDDDREGVIAAAVVEVAGRNSQLAVGAEGNQVAVAFPTKTLRPDLRFAAVWSVRAD
jgi:hypothetical protein